MCEFGLLFYCIVILCIVIVLLFYAPFLLFTCSAMYNYLGVSSIEHSRTYSLDTRIGRCCGSLMGKKENKAG